MPVEASNIPQLDIQTILHRIFPLKHSNSSKNTSPYFYIDGLVAVYLSKMVAIVVGPISEETAIKQCQVIEMLMKM